MISGMRAESSSCRRIRIHSLQISVSAWPQTVYPCVIMLLPLPAADDAAEDADATVAD